MEKDHEARQRYEELREGGHDAGAADALRIADNMQEALNDAYYALDSGPRGDTQPLIKAIIRLIKANELATEAIRALANR